MSGITGGYSEIGAFFEETKKELLLDTEIKLEIKQCACPQYFQSKNLIELPVTYGNGTIPTEEVKNTIFHELIHVRNEKEEKNEIKQSYFSSGRTLGKIGYKVFDEYVAYKEAQERYPILVKQSTADELRNEFRVTYMRSERTTFSLVDRFCYFYTSASLLIECYIVSGELSDKFQFINEAVSILDKAYSRRTHMNWDDYENLGYRFIRCIIGDSATSEEEDMFWRNTGIEDYKQYLLRA